MNSIDFIRLALLDEEKYFQEAIYDISDAELIWQPSDGANNINWIIWHMARVEDMWFNFFCNHYL